MELFDTYYFPDTPSQRYRLIGVTIPTLIAGVLPWVSPLRKWLAHQSLARVVADVMATGKHLLGYKPPYGGPAYFTQVVLVAIAVLVLLPGIKFQLGVLRAFAPGSRTLRLSQWFLALEVLMLVALFWAWPAR